MKKSFFILLFFIWYWQVDSQNLPAHIPSLLTRLAQTTVDSQRINLYIKLAACYVATGRCKDQMDSVKIYLDKARVLNSVSRVPSFENRIQLIFALRHSLLFEAEDSRKIFLPIINSCQKTFDKGTEALAWLWLGQLVDEDTVPLQQRLLYYQNSLRVARQAGDTYTEMLARATIAYLLIEENKNAEGEQELLKILKEPKAGPASFLYVYLFLTQSYLGRMQLDKALESCLKSFEMMGLSQDSTAADYMCHQMTLLYSHLGKTAESRIWSQKSLDYMIAFDNIPGYYGRFYQIIAEMRSLGKFTDALQYINQKVAKEQPSELAEQRKIQGALGEIYCDLKIYDRAKESYVKMVKLGNQQTRNYPLDERAFDNYSVGVFYFKRGLFQTALSFLDSSLSQYQAVGGILYTRAIQNWLYKTDSALGNYISAIKHLKELNRINDSAFNLTRNKQIEELELGYKTKQKNDSIQLLQGNEKLANAQLKNSQHFRNWIIAGAAFLLIIATLLYRLALLRKKNNRVVKNKNEQLQHLLKEKEWLLKEVHHRVKNNLHTVIGLLESQAAYLEDDALKANEVSKHRIYAMSLIHQQLYKTDDIKTIDMSVYLPELLDYLKESFDTGMKIRFQHDIQPIKLGVSQAIPVGLIINEAVTNAIKYAFVPGKDALINISMQETDEKVSLVIADDGIGINPALINAASTSMGLKLMNGLTEDIEGEIQFMHEEGTKIMVRFQHDRLNEFATLTKIS
jgi:two-component sensor histidine kinase